MAQKRDPHTIRASLVLAAIEEFGSHQKIIAETVMGHTERFKKIDKRFDRIDERLDGITVMVAKNTEDIEEIKGTLKRHDGILDKHTSDLTEIKSNYARRSDIVPLEHRVTLLERKVS